MAHSSELTAQQFCSRGQLLHSLEIEVDSGLSDELKRDFRQLDVAYQKCCNDKRAYKRNLEEKLRAHFVLN